MESQPPATATTAGNSTEPLHTQPQQPPSSLSAPSSPTPPISSPSHPLPIPNPNLIQTPNPKPPTPVLPQSHPPPSFSRYAPPPQSHYPHFPTIPPATPQPASSSISSTSAPRGGTAISVPAHHQNPSPPFSSSFGQHTAQVRTLMQGRGVLGYFGSQFRPMPSQFRSMPPLFRPMPSQFRPMPSQLRPVQSSLRPHPPAQNNQPAGSQMGHVDGYNPHSSRKDSLFTWTNVYEGVTSSSSLSSLETTNKDETSVSLDLKDGTDLKEICMSDQKFREFIYGEEALRIFPTELLNISQHYSMQQNFQGHGLMRPSSVGSPATPLPSQAYRQQLNPQSLQQRTHISQPQQQQQSMPTTSQQPQPLPTNQAQEHFGQQVPSSRALHVPHQPQVTRLQEPGNQKPSSPVAAQTNAVQPGNQSRLPNADPEELGKSVLGKRSIHELVNQSKPSETLKPAKKKKKSKPLETSKSAKKKKKSKPSETSKPSKKKKKLKPSETSKPAKKKKKSKPSETTSQPKPNIIEIKKSKRSAQKMIDVDSEPDVNAALDHAESDNSSLGADVPKDDQTGTKYSNIKYVVPRSTSSPLVHPISNKGSNKGSTGEVDQPVEVHQDVPPPAVSPQKSQTCDSESDSEEIEHTDMEIPDTEELNQEQPNDSSPKIPNHGEDGPDDEGEHMSNILEDPQGGEGPKNDHDQLDLTTVINQPFGTIKGFKAPSTVTSELENLKKNKPAEYLKLMMSTRGSSTCSSSSIASGGQSTVEPADKLLQRIKEKVFDVDMIHVLENDQNACYGIRDLLKQVDILTTTPEVADVIVELGFLTDQVTADLIRKREASIKIQNMTETQTAEWDAATESTNKAEELQKTFQHSQEELNTCATNISNWEQQIKELQANIQKAKERQEEIQKLDLKQVDDEIKAGLHHVERAQNLGIEIATLTSNRSVIERRLSLSKTKYERIKVDPLEKLDPQVAYILGVIADNFLELLSTDIHKESIAAIKKSMVATEAAHPRGSAGQAFGSAMRSQAKTTFNVIASPSLKNSAISEHSM